MTEAERVVVITGASSGIGLTSARMLADAGYTVFGSVRKDADAEKFVDTPGIHPLLMDVTDHRSVGTAAETVSAWLASHGGELVGLINNAGVAVSAPLAHIPLDELRNQFEINVIGLMAVTQAFLPLLQQGKPGRIINISSVAGRVTTPFLGPYAASKHAVEAISDAFRRELMPFGVKVVVIQPGPIATPIWSKGSDEVADRYQDTPYGLLMKQLLAYFRKYQSIGLRPEAVARVILLALTAPYPRTRYLVAHNKLEAYLRRAVSDKMLDRMIYKRMRLDRLVVSKDEGGRQKGE